MDWWVFEGILRDFGYRIVQETKDDIQKGIKGEIDYLKIESFAFQVTEFSDSRVTTRIQKSNPGFSNLVSDSGN